jgi:hypothetical protein
MTSIFETTGMEDPLKLWTPAVSAAGSAPGTVSFSACPGGAGGDRAVPEAADPVYRVNLPADGASASRALTDSEEYIISLNAALENVPSRLDGLVARTRERRHTCPGGRCQGKAISFDVLSLEQPESGPEAGLLSLLAEAEGKEASFGLQETASAALQQAKIGLDALTGQINRDAQHFAWVETHIAGALIARTIVGWTGAAQTACAQGLDGPQVALHSRALRIATQTRGLRLRLFVTIASGAAKVSALVATPAGAALALPAVYRYVMQIVTQVKQLEP